jgi:hypothetical protein
VSLSTSKKLPQDNKENKALYYYFQRLADSFNLEPLGSASRELLSMGCIGKTLERPFANYPGEAYRGIICDISETNETFLKNFARLDQMLPPLWLVASDKISREGTLGLVARVRDLTKLCAELAINAGLAIFADVSTCGVESVIECIRSLPDPQVGPGRPKIYLNVVFPFCTLAQNALEVANYVSVERPELTRAPVPLCGIIHWSKVRSVLYGSESKFFLNVQGDIFLSVLCLLSDFSMCPMTCGKKDSVNCYATTTLPAPSVRRISYNNLEEFIKHSNGRIELMDSIGNCLLKKERTAILEADADYAVISMECQDL